ncbi:nucleoside/nucleotide kinase family protein [Mycolicibacterium komossense]|uniref:Nucleoside/nucleotide kinase family protein n=1 Tax=Mycolicibacterium komossense TaxID=1779 RepID=A0ABT3C6Q4_9MYCO|nr:nucleoside/nucleotide kinase family protein [Mycolicibacterium komossense]
MEAAVARAKEVAARGPGRRVIGLAGAPGAGKSTLAAELIARVPGSALLAMDGFHLADELLEVLGRRARKGAPDTFDAAGFASALRRIRAGEDVVVPRFDRSAEIAVAGAIRIPATAPLVITEGNYLLLDSDGWEPVRALIDECWYVDVDDELRRNGLVARHIDHGRSTVQAQAWVDSVDEPNARRIASTKAAADAIVQLR